MTQSSRVEQGIRQIFVLPTVELLSAGRERAACSWYILANVLAHMQVPVQVRVELLWQCRAVLKHEQDIWIECAGYLHELLPMALTHGRVVKVRHQWQRRQHGLQTLLKQPAQHISQSHHPASCL